MAMRRKVLLGALAALAAYAYVAIGVVVGIGEYRHQAARFDPGFDPVIAGVIAGAIWPLVLVGRWSR